MLNKNTTENTTKKKVRTFCFCTLTPRTMEEFRDEEWQEMLRDGYTKAEIWEYLEENQYEIQYYVTVEDGCEEPQEVWRKYGKLPYGYTHEELVAQYCDMCDRARKELAEDPEVRYIEGVDEMEHYTDEY